MYQPDQNKKEENENEEKLIVCGGFTAFNRGFTGRMRKVAGGSVRACG